MLLFFEFGSEFKHIAKTLSGFNERNLFFISDGNYFNFFLSLFFLRQRKTNTHEKLFSLSYQLFSFFHYTLLF